MRVALLWGLYRMIRKLNHPFLMILMRFYELIMFLQKNLKNIILFFII